jgi:hypothetical protein
MTDQDLAARIAQARRDLEAAKADPYIQSVIAKAPPLTRAQRDLLATLLNPPPGGWPK